MHCCSVYGIMEKASVACFDDPVVLCFMVDIRLWLRGFSEGHDSSNVSPLADFLLPAPLSHGIRLLASSSTQNTKYLPNALSSLCYSDVPQDILATHCLDRHVLLAGMKSTVSAGKPHHLCQRQVNVCFYEGCTDTGIGYQYQCRGEYSICIRKKKVPIPRHQYPLYIYVCMTILSNLGSSVELVTFTPCSRKTCWEHLWKNNKKKKIKVILYCEMASLSTQVSVLVSTEKQVLTCSVKKVVSVHPLFFC